MTPEAKAKVAEMGSFLANKHTTKKRIIGPARHYTNRGAASDGAAAFDMPPPAHETSDLF